jgi:predicted transcriptional regulator
VAQAPGSLKAGKRGKMASVPEKKMAKRKPVFDEIDKEAEAQAIAEAEADVKAGRVVPHEDVVKWLESWGTPDDLPCPVPGKN